MRAKPPRSIPAATATGTRPSTTSCTVTVTSGGIRVSGSMTSGVSGMSSSATIPYRSSGTSTRRCALVALRSLAARISAVTPMVAMPAVFCTQVPSDTRCGLSDTVSAPPMPGCGANRYNGTCRTTAAT